MRSGPGPETSRKSVRGSAAGPRPRAPAPEALVERPEGLEELRHVAQQVEPDDLDRASARRSARGRRSASRPEVAGLVEPVAQGQPERTALEEADDARRRLQEVERLPRRRRVEDDPAMVAASVAPRTAARPPCTRGCPRGYRRGAGSSGCRRMRSRGLRVGSVGRHQPVEGAPGIEQAGGEAATGPRGDLHLAIARGIADTQGVLEPQRRIEGHHQGVEPGVGRRQPERGGEGRLADPAGADDDEQRRFGGAGVHAVAPPASRARCSASSSSGLRSKGSNGSSQRGPCQTR